MSLLLPEHKPDLKTCQACELSTHGSRFIWGEGNPRAPVFVILDNPGAREDKTGTPFLCGTRQTLLQGAREAGLSLDQLYVTYILKCRPRKKYNKPQARQTCLKYLTSQLKTTQPTVIFCLGTVASQAFFQDATISVKELRGFPHLVKNYPTFVSYHPLNVRRRPVLYPYFLQDWQLIHSFLKPM
ncbi:MAG TPA: uracil-DNA glycosylase [Clostridia bacterium]|jgi:uracil-DNA glycosylase family 4|nr:uracil-DNA glycosylase [Clostridia bacterium]